jgi:hypothetical protein
MDPDMSRPMLDLLPESDNEHSRNSEIGHHDGVGALR